MTSSSHHPSPALPPLAHWDLFCSVVDNFGDIGVCWRLARQLAAEHAISVRLWVDDLHSAERLVPKPFAPLPLLGVPGWWPANEAPGFYDDAQVFRPLRAAPVP